MTGSIHQGNVGFAEDCRRTVNEVLEQHGRLDVLVNNAGITIDKTALKLTDEDWYKVLAVNLSGAFFMSQAVLPHMLERGTGRIINISSIVGSTGNMGQTNYSASKSGHVRARRVAGPGGVLPARARRQALEASIGLTVNAVAPGFIYTEMLQAMPEKAQGAKSPNPGGPVRPPGQGGARRPLPGVGLQLVHHGRRVRRQRRPRHVTRRPTAS